MQGVVSWKKLPLRDLQKFCKIVGIFYLGISTRSQKKVTYTGDKRKQIILLKHSQVRYFFKDVIDSSSRNVLLFCAK